MRAPSDIELARLGILRRDDIEQTRESDVVRPRGAPVQRIVTRPIVPVRAFWRFRAAQRRARQGVGT